MTSDAQALLGLVPMAIVWGWYLRILHEPLPPLPNNCGHTELEHSLGREIGKRIEAVHVSMSCVGVADSGAGYVVIRSVLITIPGKPTVELTIRGETA